MSDGGPMVSLWDALSTGLWLAGLGLIAVDTAARWDGRLDEPTVIGMVVIVVAATMTVTSAIHHATEEILSQMFKAFEAGQESIRQIKR